VNGYVQFKPYNKDFYADDFAKGVKEDQGNNTFLLILQRAADKKAPKKLEKTLKDQHAMYLYGGRKALVREFTAIRRDGTKFILTPASGKKLAVFHGRITVGLNKTKRILMIANTSSSTTPPLSVLNGRRLMVDLGDSYQTHAPGTGHHGFYNKLDLPGLDQIVHEIPD
jgi:hypothetical protein